MAEELILQSLRALAYYAALILVMRLAGKRLAGQTTTFDLLILITLGTVLQRVAVKEDVASALVFIVTVFVVHKVIAILCAKYTFVRHLVRGKPKVLVRDGKILHDALKQEGLSKAELLAGLRKLGHDHLAGVKLAVLEETGHISAIGDETKTSGSTRERGDI